jgi:putative protease
MSPAGSFECLMAAIKAGAGSVYFGVGELNMRARSAKFQLNDLEKIAAICKKNKVNSYLTLNTVMYDSDIKSIRMLCDTAKAAGISAVIACDFAVINYANSIGLPVHMSTQANISNIEAVKFYSKFTDTIVLARELSIEQIKHICREIKKQNIKGPNNKPVQIEVFVHGALCVSISGKCYMSLAQYNHSANRGACLQACRRQYKVTDIETNDELNINNNFVMSPKDLCTIGMLDRLIEAGPTVFKIEGRARGPEYVYTVTKAYKEAIKAVQNKKYSPQLISKLRNELKTVFNRGFWENGYYMGRPAGEWAGIYGSKATKEKIQVGKVINYFKKNNVAHILIDSSEMQRGDDIMITGPTTGVVFVKADSIQHDSKNIKSAKKGSNITMPIKETVRVNDKVFVVKNRKTED